MTRGWFAWRTPGTGGVLADEVVSHAFSHGYHPQHVERLDAYWGRAIACFDRALEDADLAGDDRIRQVLHDYFAWATTTTMARYHRSQDDVPEGMTIPRWSWDGLTGGAGG